jgi:hypothetical protein
MVSRGALIATFARGLRQQALRCEKTLRGWLEAGNGKSQDKPRGVTISIPIRLFARVYSISPMGLGRLLVDSELRLDS